MEGKSCGHLRRRDFLALPVAAAAVAAVPGIGAGAAAAAEPEWRNKQSGMTYRRLGRTGLMVSSMGMGGDDIRPDNNDFVNWAVDLGLNYFDTAPHYGMGASERGYADVVKRCGRDRVLQNTKVNVFPNRTMVYRRMFQSLEESEQNQIRNKVMEEIARRGLENPDYLGSYFSGQADGLRSAMIANALHEKYAAKFDRQKEIKAYIVNSVEGSLKALGTDHLDCLLMRGVETPFELRNTPEVLEAFESLRKQGKARFLGFSAHTDPAGILEAAIETGTYSMGMIAYHFLNAKWVDPVLEKAKKADFGVMAMKSSRVVQNPFNRRQLIPERARALDKLVPGKMTLFQKGFHWALQNPNLSGVVVGISDMAMAKEDIPLAMTAEAAAATAK
ncbi:MAG: aldo/keto reductase [Candidatus Solibacter sp.]|nr:aldo/keto reductase [Candidatus Solibacter sp.]